MPRCRLAGRSVVPSYRFMTRPPGVPPPKDGCQLPRASLRRGEPPSRGLAVRPQGSNFAAKPPEEQARGREREARPGTELRSPVQAPSCPRAPPAAGVSLRQGAPAPASLCPSGRASLGPCLPARPLPPPVLVQAAGAERRIPVGRGGGPRVPRKGPTRKVPGRKGSGRAAARGGGARPPRRAGPSAPAPTARGMAQGLALPLLCVPAVWAAAALLLCVSGTSGRTSRSAPAWAHLLRARARGFRLVRVSLPS